MRGGFPLGGFGGFPLGGFGGFPLGGFGGSPLEVGLGGSPLGGGENQERRRQFLEGFSLLWRLKNNSYHHG